MAKSLAIRDGQGSRKYLPQMQKDVDRVRREYAKFGAEVLFDKHVLPVLDFALSQNIVTASEVEKPKEKGNRKLALLILCHHLKEAPWYIARMIADDLVDDLKLDNLDKNPNRKYSEYVPILRKPDGTLAPRPVLNRIAQKAQYEESDSHESYGIDPDNPGIRVPQDWEAEKEAMLEADLVVYRKLANILGYRGPYNKIGERYLKETKDVDIKALAAEVKRERAELEQAFQNTKKATDMLLKRVEERLSREGIPYILDPRDEKGEASMVFKIKKYRDEGGQDKRNKSVLHLNDSVAASFIIRRKDGQKTENIGDVRKVEGILIEEAEKMKESGEFPYGELNAKYYSVNPKPNLYRADHFEFVFQQKPGQKPKFVNVEIKVLTEEMEQFNNYGGAAHIAYKDGKEYENASGIAQLREAILSSIGLFLDWLSQMNGKPNGSRYTPFPMKSASPVSQTATLLVKRMDGTTQKMKVPFQDGDLALDALARSGLSLEDHYINGGKCFNNPIEPGDSVVVVQGSQSMNRSLARNLFNSKTPFKQFTRQKLAEVFQNGNGKSKKKEKGSRKRRKTQEIELQLS